LGWRDYKEVGRNIEQKEKMNKRELSNLIIGTFLVVLFFIAFTSIMDQVQASEAFASWYKMDLYTDHHHSSPSLVINHNEGKPGSYFTLTGCDYPANATATVTINGNTLGNIQVDDFGCFVFELSSSQADDGSYFVTVAVNPSATTSFRVDSNSPNTWGSEGGGTSFSVPAGIAFTEYNYLPIIFR
jgi:hypothetical protein